MDAIDAATSRTGVYRRVLAAVADGETLEPRSRDAQLACWVERLGVDPHALRHVVDSRVATARASLGRIATPALVVVGDADDGHACADELAAALPNARFVRVPGDHFSALASPELGTQLLAFLGHDGPAWSARSCGVVGVLRCGAGAAPRRLRTSNRP